MTHSDNHRIEKLRGFSPAAIVGALTSLLLALPGCGSSSDDGRPNAATPTAVQTATASPSVTATATAAPSATASVTRTATRTPIATPTASETATPTASETPQSTSDPEIVASDLARHIRTLASDEYEGRSIASAGETKTIAYIADEMRRIGLEPVIGDSFFQPVPLVEITLKPEESSFSIGNEGALETLAYGDQAVYWTKRQTESVAIDDTDVVFVGYGVVAPEYDWNDYAGIDVHGKTVVMFVNDPGFATHDASLFKGSTLTYYGFAPYKVEEAARQGAAAAILIFEDYITTWDAIRIGRTGPIFDFRRPDKNASRVAIEAWITRAVANRLFAAAGLDIDALKLAANQRGFRPVAMTGVKAAGSLANTLRNIDSNNVVGVLPGAERPDEYLLYTAHWDHFGMRDGPADQDNIFNGAVDNATGVAGILEVAEAFASSNTRPARSIMFVAFTAEERGLLGSAFFAEDPPAPPRNIAAGINTDVNFPFGRMRNLGVVGYGMSELEDYLRDAAALQGRVLTPYGLEGGGYYRSDHLNLAKKGVPMLYACCGENSIEHGLAWGQAESAAYFAQRYHTPGDEYDESWDLSGMEEDFRLLHEVGRQIADLDGWPNWYEGTEFRAIRDASRAGE